MKYRGIELLSVIIKMYIKNEINVKYVFPAKAFYSLSDHFFGRNETSSVNKGGCFQAGNERSWLLSR